MKIAVPIFLAFSLALTPVAPGAVAAGVDAARIEKLDGLFGELKRARDPRDADRVAKQIWDMWFDSGSASINLMMQWSNDAIKERKFAVALDFLDSVVTLAPDFAEGWNRRATVHFMMDNYAKSMADIDRTLRLEPRHFGALGGMAMIMKNTGRKRRALEAYRKVLEYYPMMRSAQEEVIELSEDLAGEGI